jgi:hypothetical protein
MERRSILNLWFLTASAFDAVSREHADRLLSVNKFYVFSAVLKGESPLRHFVLTGIFLLAL